MLITFFIGNGFDLNNGMATKFTDFYEYIKTIKTKKEINDNHIYSNIKKDKDKWSYFEMQLGKLTFEYTQETKSKLLEDLESFRNDFIDYMTIQNKYFSFDKSEAKKILISSLTRYMYQLNEVEKKDLLAIYNQIASDRKFNFINFNYTDSLEQIVTLFGVKESIGVSAANGYRFNNYLGKVIPIHKQLKTGMFLGVNDETQINSNIFDSDEKMSLIKPLSNDAFRDNTNEEVQSLVSQSNIIVLYGMSLGETDRIWWEYLGKWLEKSPNNRLIIYIHDRQFSKNSPLNYFRKRKYYENRFIGFSYDLGDLNNKDIQNKINSLRKKIYLIPNSESDFKFIDPTGINNSVTNLQDSFN